MEEKAFFMDGSKLDYHKKEVKTWLEGKQIFPIHVEISPTSGCNHNCILCCVDYKKHKRQDLSEELMNRIPEDFAEAGVKSYLLAGEGEPFLNKYCVPMVQRAKELGIDGSMTSNGVYFTPDISEATMAGFSWIRYSIQSFEPKLFSKIHRVSEKQLEKTLENIKHSVKVRKEQNLETKIGIQQILINENWDNLVESASRAKELGVDYWTIKRFSKHPHNSYNVPEELPFKCENQFKQAEELSDENFQVKIRRNQFENQPRTYNRCVGLPFITNILADGKVYPCCQFFTNPKMNYGNLYENTLKEIMSSEKTNRMISDIRKNYDVEKNDCMTYCRHHSTNLYLLDVLEHPERLNRDFGKEPEHVNFI